MIPRTPIALMLAALLLAGCSKEKPRDAKLETNETPKPKPDKEVAKPDKEVAKPDPPKKEKEAPKSVVAREVFPAPYVEREEPVVAPTDARGVIRGRVLWSGSPLTPVASEQDVSVNGQKLRIPATTPLRIDPTTRGVADVMVWIEAVPPSVKSNASSDATLTQSRGVYRPRVQFVAEGTKLTLRTTDDEADFSGSGRLRFTRLLRRGEQKQVLLPKAGLVAIRSDDRPGIQEAYVRAIDHAHHAVTGSNGEFELPPLPPGKYDVLLWPVGMSRNGKNVRQRVAVEIADGRGASIEWTLSRWER